ncbi:MAG TPA: HAMP domain-containing sensor histidine kinase [Lacunisphaera sp.]|jgi:signal transduction histidine kinase
MNSSSTAPARAGSSTSTATLTADVKRPGIYFLGLSGPARDAAEQATKLAFPDEKIHVVTTCREIGEHNGERCLAILGNAEAVADLTSKSAGAPGCAVVVMGRDRSDLAETVPPEEWNPPLLARAFRSALLEQELLRENARLRGDLKTVARRVSHDLRTPLGCIYTTSGVFKELPAGDQESILTMAGIIKESSGEISQIVDRVSFILKASADPIASSRVDMGGVVASVLTQLATELQKADARIALPSSWPEASGVATWLQVVWSNLLRNAFQHGGPSAAITLAWKPVENGFCFSVFDRGRGVAESKNSTLFPPFEQLHSMHVPGLGLSFVQRLVALQGGECGYEKTTEDGTCFYFTLPAAR